MRRLQAVWRRRKYDCLVVLLSVGILCALETPSYAFLGLGDIVYDPAVQMAVLEGVVVGGAALGVNTATLAQVIQGVQIAMSEYQRIDPSVRGGWKTSGQMPNIDATINQVGELAGWSDVMNGKVGIAPAVWAQATIGIKTTPEIWSEEIPGQSQVLAPLASIEAIDGSASRCLDQVAQARGNWGLNQTMIMNLINAQNDGTDGLNGTVGQINITNGTLEQGNEESRTQTAIQSCLVEQTALANKIQRDNLATELNGQAERLLEIETMPTLYDGGTTFTKELP